MGSVESEYQERDPHRENGQTNKIIHGEKFFIGKRGSVGNSP